MKYLVCVDFSPHSKAALEEALRLKRSEDKLILLHVAEQLKPSLLTLARSGFDPQLKDMVNEQNIEDAEEILRIFAEQAMEEGVSDATLLCVLSTKPKETLVDEITQLHVDTVFIGSHGLTGVKKNLLGSVSSYLLDHLNVSTNVYVVRRTTPKEITN